MNKIQVLSGQSLSDIAIQYTGDLKNTYAIAFFNNKSVTEPLAVGEWIAIPDELILKSIYEIVPANAISNYQEDLLQEELGIGTMIIESTFIVA